MTRRRFIADEVSGNLAALTGEHAGHLVRVLRARVGQEFDVATSSGVRRGRISRVEDGRVEFELGELVREATVDTLTLFLAIFKFDRMEWAIEKCTELGVSRIVPVIARRTDAHLAAASGKRVERWRRLALQASEQSRRAAPPQISAPVELAEATSRGAGMRIVLSETEQQVLLRDVIDVGSPNADVDSPNRENEITLAVGPEGGWTEGELKDFQQAGWIAASLGGTILRAETAAIAATAVVISRLH